MSETCGRLPAKLNTAHNAFLGRLFSPQAASTLRSSAVHLPFIQFADKRVYQTVMTIRSKITLSITALALLVLTLAASLLWSLERGGYDMQRTRLAYEELAGYLQVAADVYRTAKLARRDLDREAMVDTAELIQARQRLFATRERIAQIVTAEADAGLRDDEGFEETERLEALTAGLDALLSGLDRVRVLNATGDRGGAVALLDALVDAEINDRLQHVIEDGIADERSELDEALENHNAVRWLVVGIGIAVATSGVVLAVGSIVLLVRQVRRPLGALEQWAAQVTSGDLDARIALSGSGEFDRLGHRFNHMADEIGQYRRQLERARDALEAQVAARTDELRAANAELRRRDLLRQQFFADVGHELRTPITALRGEAEIALRARGGREQRYREALEQIVKVSGQLTRFVNDIFLIARAEAGIADLRRGAVELDHEVRVAVEQMRTVAVVESQAARITTTLPAKPALIAGDADRLRQLVMILVQNSIEHGHSGVAVEVAVREVAGQVILEVRDDGPGIAPEDAPNVFDRLYRGHRSDSDGSGLGLPIARSIVLAHHGQIALETALGHGTRVVVRFESAGADAPDEAALIAGELGA